MFEVSFVFNFFSKKVITLSDFYKSIFGCKVYKIAVDAGCTCPNRDGTKGFGGCIFCSSNGSGDFIPSKTLDIKSQIEIAKTKVLSKLQGRTGSRDGKFIAYFQNFTSTYGNIDELSKKYEEALSCKDVIGLAIGTRPDCLSDEMLFRLSKISESYFVQLELGLQTSNEKTGVLINRCYTNYDFEDSVKRIKSIAPKIHIVSHLIFGLPFETDEDMLSSIDFVLKNKVDGIKITVLYILKETKIEKMFLEKQFNVLSKEEYFELLKKAIKKFPENLVVHRLTGDPPKSVLVEPKWTEDKKRVLNDLKKLLTNF